MPSELSHPDKRDIAEKLKVAARDASITDTVPLMKVLSEGYRDAGVCIVRKREKGQHFTSDAFLSKEEALEYIEGNKRGRGRFYLIEGTIGELEDGSLGYYTGWWSRMWSKKRYLDAGHDAAVAMFYLRERYFPTQPDSRVRRP
jgi:hypothetical protein